jgi:serine phosphatase RsbU (regulator of sigma subunit)
MRDLESRAERGTTDSISEIENFEEIATYLVPSPGDIPELSGIDIYGRSIPLNGIIGGDHIIYLDFKKRYDLDRRVQAAQEEGRTEVVRNLLACKQKAGVAIADVSGHLITDGLLALMLHQAFLLGAYYELDLFGELTTRLFENLNSRFFRSSSVSKFLTLLYGEISEQGTFRFMSAAHPIPVVFSRKYDSIVDISSDIVTTFPPIGTLPSREDIDRNKAKTILPFKGKYEVAEINLMGYGDILLLYTDGLSEHFNGEDEYFPGRLEEKLREVKRQSAREIFEAIAQDVTAFSPRADDLSFVVIKRL